MQQFRSGMASCSQANIKAKMNDRVQRVTQFNHCVKQVHLTPFRHVAMRLTITPCHRENSLSFYVREICETTSYTISAIFSERICQYNLSHFSSSPCSIWVTTV